MLARLAREALGALALARPLVAKASIRALGPRVRDLVARRDVGPRVVRRALPVAAVGARPARKTGAAAEGVAFALEIAVVGALRVDRRRDKDHEEALPLVPRHGAL